MEEEQINTASQRTSATDSDEIA
jgi:hypothetical protein